jgi:hypothetical protein
MLLLSATACSAKLATFDARDPQSPLRLVRTIPLPNVHGRIDHLALDEKSNHLFVAEIASGSVDDVDLASGAVAGRISGLREPQGVAWLAAQDEVAVACGDGTVPFYRSSDRREVARISLGGDADNVRVDGRNGTLVIGYGSGALAVIDASTHRVLRELKLPAHPEAFELIGSRVFVNVPNAHAIVIGDLDRARVITTLRTGTHFGNYPMASDSSGSRVAVGFRLPSSLSILDSSSGATLASGSICGDADDLYFHADEVVVVCGSGAVELVQAADARGSAEVITTRGARTGLLDSRSGQLFLAVPAGRDPAAIWELSFR